MNIVDEIFALFERRGDREYFGETVSQRDHALQVAHFAVQDRAKGPLTVASLLHDIGHLLTGEEGMAERGFDGRHENSGNAWLRQHFSPAVTEPVRMHVAAKRYLCYAEPDYLRGLSDASILSLKLQGGMFNEREATNFLAQPYAHDAVRLRRWDDRGKILGLEVAPIESYRELLTCHSRPIEL